MVKANRVEKLIYHSIHEAVNHGDVEELEKMVKSGASINAVQENRDKFTPLHCAAAVGALECFHWLLWHGADPVVCTPHGWTPAHIAAIRGQDACLQALINNGVSMSSVDARGSSPAHLAAAHGNSFSLATILRSGAAPNAVDKQGWTPMHSAAYHGRLGCCQMLVKWGATIDEVDNVGNTPAHLASMEGHLAVLKYLITTSHSTTGILSARNDHGEVPKMLAQQFFKTNVVQYIEQIELERDYPEEQQDVAFPAHIAAYKGDIGQLRMLIENGVVNINERDDHGGTPAHKAAGQGHLKILQWLIEMGANLQVQNQAGETPKDVARRFGQLAALKVLGANTSEKDDDEGGAVAGLQYDSNEDDPANPPYGSTEGDGIKPTAKQIKEAQTRAKKKIDELERLLEIARENFKQLGGTLTDKEKIKLREAREYDRKQAKQIEDLGAQLEYERLKREKLEAERDEFRREIAHLNAQIEELSPYPCDSEELRAALSLNLREQRSSSHNRARPRKDPVVRSSSPRLKLRKARPNSAGTFVKRTLGPQK